VEPERSKSGTQPDLGVILEVFNGLPGGEQRRDAT
jgi:hypothetical protein